MTTLTTANAGTYDPTRPMERSQWRDQCCYGFIALCFNNQLTAADARQRAYATGYTLNEVNDAMARFEQKLVEAKGEIKTRVKQLKRGAR